MILVTGFLSRPIKAKVPYWFKNPKLKGADKISLEDNNTNTEGESKMMRLIMMIAKMLIKNKTLLKKFKL